MRHRRFCGRENRKFSADGLATAAIYPIFGLAPLAFGPGGTALRASERSLPRAFSQPLPGSILTAATAEVTRPMGACYIRICGGSAARPKTPIRENVERRVSRVDRSKGGPYNPPTADEAAPQGADGTSETLEIAKKFEISKRVLTGSRVSNTTRLADDVER